MQYYITFVKQHLFNLEKMSVRGKTLQVPQDFPSDGFSHPAVFPQFFSSFEKQHKV